MNPSQQHDLVCAPRLRPLSRGVFFGESPFSAATSILLAQIAICAFSTALLNHFLAPLRQSLFISQILAGVILGPSLLGSIPAFRDTLFPISSFHMVDIFSLIGVMFFSFILGVRTDLSLIQKSGRKTVIIGICTFLFPLFLNFFVGRLLNGYVQKESDLYRTLIWVGSFQATSSFHAVICFLSDLKLMNSELGRLAISTSTLSGICSSFWILIVFTVVRSDRIEPRVFLLTFLFLGIMVVCAVFVFRPIILHIVGRTSNAKSVKESHVCVVFILVLLFALYGECFGQMFIYGPMILGMVIPDGPPLGSALVEKIEFFVSYNMLPILFVVSAAGIDFSAISLRNILIIELMAVVSFLCKVGGVVLPSLYWRIPTGKALCLGLILSNQGIMEVLILERAKAMEIIDKESYTIMVLSISVFTAILSPIVKSWYKPSRKYSTGRVMTIQHNTFDSNLRVLACLHCQEHTPSALNIFEALYPNPGAPMLCYVVHLLDLAGRTAPVLVSHDPSLRSTSYSNESDHIINAVRYFEAKNQGYLAMHPYTSIAPYETMHDDVCLLVVQNNISLVITMFHQQPSISTTTDGASNAIRSVNANILKESPCSVGILIDLNNMNHCPSATSANDIYRVGVIFLGGPDDREALALACLMARHPNISVTLIRFVNDDGRRGDTYPSDEPVINMYKEVQMQNKECFYQEEAVKDTVGVINMIRSSDGCFDLVLVGRRHDEESALLGGLQEWKEYPELGSVGDMMLAMEMVSKPSILVVQQGFSGDDDPFNEDFDWYGTSSTSPPSSAVELGMAKKDGKAY